MPRALRAAVAIIASVGLVMLAAACGGSNKVASVGSSSTSEYLSFASCMRLRGISDFPDPVTGSGGHPGFLLQGGSSSDLNAKNPAFQRGVDACQHLLGHRFRFVFTPSGVGKGA
jgi:hypothetical protein